MMKWTLNNHICWKNHLGITIHEGDQYSWISEVNLKGVQGRKKSNCKRSHTLQGRCGEVDFWSLPAPRGYKDKVRDNAVLNWLISMLSGITWTVSTCEYEFHTTLHRNEDTILRKKTKDDPWVVVRRTVGSRIWWAQTVWLKKSALFTELCTRSVANLSTMCSSSHIPLMHSEMWWNEFSGWLGNLINAAEKLATGWQTRRSAGAGNRSWSTSGRPKFPRRFRT